GPWIGGFICGILILLTADPIQAIYFGLFVLFLQQFDCNFLTPKIVGNYIGLPAFWVLVACLLGGGFYGIIGLILGVPIFAISYQLFRDFVSHRLKNKKLPSDTSNYLTNGKFWQNITKTKE
ncbi:MAG: AI-2E family transporter, partial [Sphingobacteriia bacterium]|nr:AI-2E family transporter [Sphingobacteriia bacterium]